MCQNASCDDRMKVTERAGFLVLGLNPAARDCE
jgi:hypothetical protein